MTLHTLDAAQAMAQLDGFDAVIDARSPAEFADDHLPDAVNWPTLDDDERVVIGTEHKQRSAFGARKHGAVLAARRIAEHLEQHVQDKPAGWRPLVYCWRGGQRSGTLAWFLSAIGFRVHVIQGGYQAFRAQVRASLEDLPSRLNFVVVAGRTGSGKTRLLQALRAEGAQVLDLEGLACHRGSILGGWPSIPQPSQKHFEMRVWDTLRRFNADHPVYVESESRKIGARQVPDALLSRMREQGRPAVIEMADDARVNLLLEEYAFYTRDVERFTSHLESLVTLRGRETVQRWQTAAREGRWREVYRDLMCEHYDPLYLRSMARNYAMRDATTLTVPDGSEASMRLAARELIALESSST